MTCEAGNQGDGTAPAVPRPGSVTNAAMRALIEFSKEERLVGAACAHDSFDGILAEHALALEEARDMLREALDSAAWGAAQEPCAQAARDACRLIDEQITHIRALGSIAQKEETDAHED